VKARDWNPRPQNIRYQGPINLPALASGSLRAPKRLRPQRRRDGFLEWAKVHDNYYGTLRKEVEPFRDRGTGVILVIDVQGAAQVRARCPDHLSIFMRTSAPDLLEERLRARGTEDEAAIQRRLTNARKELERAGEYQVQVVNDDLTLAVARLSELIEGEFRRARNHA